jgi:uncharacterized membrane protein YGL010W
MRSAQSWFDEYGESHQNSTNKLIHWICVPSIFFTVIGLFYIIPNGVLLGLFEGVDEMWLHWDILLTLGGLLFYLMMSRTLFLGFLLYTSANLWLIRYLDAQIEIGLGWWILGIFAVAWIGQFIGHRIEGKKPSFLKDIQFLLIGPAWLMGFVYKRLGIPY